MREVKPTQKPVPSSDIKDLFFNSGLLDIWATSLERKYIDRFGNCHLTAAGMEWLFKELVDKFKVDMNTAIVAAGYITVDSFQQGADLPNNELTQRNHILRDEITGEYYRWDGDLPKQVLAGSTPQSTGGIGKGAWVSVGDASLRMDISSKEGAGVVKWRNHSVGDILDRAVYSSDFSTLDEFAKFPAGKKVLEEGVYTINSPLVFNDDVINDFSTSGKVIINCTEPMIALTVGSEYTDNLGKINKVDAGSYIITLKANPSFEIKSGDMLFIHNPVDFSFSPHRSYYRQGESVTVKSVSGTSITLAGAIFDSYPDDCVLIKPLFRKLKVSGDIEVNFPVETGEHSYSAASLGLLLSQLRDTDTSGLKVKATQGAYAIIARHCVNTSGVSMVGMQRLTDGFTTHGLDYGINLANCQNVNFKGLFIGERHGATTSGSGYIVNRFCNIEGEIKTTGLGLQPAADWHGNTEFCSYGGYLQGLIFGGDNNTVKSGTVVDGYAIGSNSPVMIGAELLGLNFDFSGITINSYDLPHVRSYGIVDVGGATNAISDNTRRGGKIKLDYSIINGIKAEQAIKIRNRGSGKDYSFSGVGMKINTLTGKRPVWLSAISGSEFKNATVNGASFPDNSEIILVVREGRVGVDKYGKFEATIASGQSETTVTVETMPDLTIGVPLFSNAVVDNVKSGQTSFSFIASVISSAPKSIRVKIKSTAGGTVSSDTIVSCSFFCIY